MSDKETVTRSGRKIKKPDRWEPEEDVIDDFNDDEYDTDDGSDVSSIVSYSDEDEDSDVDSFIVDDDDIDE